MERVAAASTTFALDLFRKLSENDPGKNLFFSPLSMSSTLTMVFLGAEGNTAAQMSKVLRVTQDQKSEPKEEKSKTFPDMEQQKVRCVWPSSVTSTYQQKQLEHPVVLSVNKTEEIHQGYQKLISEINKPGTKYLLRLANRLYGEATYEFLSTFTDACEKFYHAGLERLNFAEKAEDSRRHINSWVEEKTACKIKNLLTEGIINSLTRLVLVNAIYFKGNWADQFLQDRTMERPFKINKNETRPVQMMHKKAKFNLTYIADYQTQILELPYVDKELSMIILLPDEIQDNSTGLEKLEREITYEKLMDWISPEMMDLTQVELSLPKFKLEEKYDLKPVLSSMGMTEAFDMRKANFTRMSSGNDLFLSEVVHKSFIEVNEEGTEAAAATAAIMMLRCAMIVPQFTADHPFLFFIRHNKTGTILFCGRFCSPHIIALPFLLAEFRSRNPSRLLSHPPSSCSRLLPEAQSPESVFSAAHALSDCCFALQSQVIPPASNADSTPGKIFTMEKLAAANAQFALSLFQKFREANPTGNICYSPFSISIEIAMIFLGARDNTATQIAKISHFDVVDDVHSKFQTLNAEFNRSNAPYILKVANRLYGEKSYSFLQDFLTSTQKLYGAELSAIDFQNSADDARKQINQWVKEQTEGKIPDLLAEGSLNEMTRLVLVNAIYFKGSWAEKFQEEDTEERAFRLNKKETKMVKMMYLKKKLPFMYIPEYKCRVLELPYKGGELSMIFLLPDDIEDNSTGLEQLEKELTLAKLQQWTQPEKMSSFNDVHVHLPKFKLEESYDLKSSLSALGMWDVFDSGKANLSGMSASRELYVSKIVHKSFIEVNEEGTEAAAATAGMMVLCSLPMEEDFNADHPFLFFIRHNPTKTILFLGRVGSP
ncbi:uncharacterized protein LOC129333908 [Eublepharis macularius]|uniref:Leukocyte elastase inhibitor n=1 Tax=Eublepharis macularius TaxID=481883 RepID=A0AA97JPA7_EUBMA|nr:uncharacterized protein LOC129333908 [Eublepharis macularius]